MIAEPLAPRAAPARSLVLPARSQARPRPSQSTSVVPNPVAELAAATTAARTESKRSDPGLPVRWLRQAVMLASLSGAGVVGALALHAGCAFLTAVFRASVAMTSVAGLGLLLSHVLVAQITEPGNVMEQK